jgi:hypothetical protein
LSCIISPVLAAVQSSADNIVFSFLVSSKTPEALAFVQYMGLFLESNLGGFDKVAIDLENLVSL